MAEQEIRTPRAFLSYSWTSEKHEAWVVRLAEDLVENGVDVVLDKWNLKEGDDKYAFMERMVTDTNVDKVIAICDALYAEKADGREGGVGAETQIISKEVYEQVDSRERPQRFVAVVTEYDENDQPCVPTFLRSRIYIDMSDADLWEERFEQLLRWLFDKPVHQKPALGKPPRYLLEERETSLGTSTKHRRALDGLRQQKPYALAAARDFLDTFASNVESMRVEIDPRDELDDRVFVAIESSLPHRDEVVDVCLALAKFCDDSSVDPVLRTFFEQLLPLGFWPKSIQTWTEGLADNFAFLNLELFLYAIAALLKHNRFEAVDSLLARDFYFPPVSNRVKDSMVSFSEFNADFRSVHRWDEKQERSWLSPVGELLKRRSTRTDLRFEHVMQSDFVLYLRTVIHGGRWWPHTLIYASWFFDRPFEIFARSQSESYFNRAKRALGVASADEIRSAIVSLKNEPRLLPVWQGDSFNPAVLANMDRLCTLS